MYVISSVRPASVRILPFILGHLFVLCARLNRPSTGR